MTPEDLARASLLQQTRARVYGPGLPSWLVGRQEVELAVRLLEELAVTARDAWRGRSGWRLVADRLGLQHGSVRRVHALECGTPLRAEAGRSPTSATPELTAGPT